MVEKCIEKDMKAEFWIFLSVLQKYCSIFSESPSILSCQNHSDFFCTTKKRSDSSWNAFLKPAAQILYILIQHVGRHLMNLFVCTYVQLLNSLLTGLLHYLGLYSSVIPSHRWQQLGDPLENTLKSA